MLLLCSMQHVRTGHSTPVVYFAVASASLLLQLRDFAPESCGLNPKTNAALLFCMYLQLSGCPTAVRAAAISSTLKGIYLVPGDHTRSIMVSTPSLAAGGIMKFAKVRYSCLGCKATLAPGDTTLCKHCRNKVICYLLDALILLLGLLASKDRRK